MGVQRPRLGRGGARPPRDEAELANELARTDRAHHLLRALAVRGHIRSDELDRAGGDDVEEVGRVTLLVERLVGREAHMAEGRQHSLEPCVAQAREEAQPLQTAEHGAALRCAPA